MTRQFGISSTASAWYTIPNKNKIPRLLGRIYFVFVNVSTRSASTDTLPSTERQGAMDIIYPFQRFLNSPHKFLIGSLVTFSREEVTK